MASLVPANGKSLHHASRSNPDFTSSINTQHVKTVKLYRQQHCRRSNKANGYYLVRHASIQIIKMQKKTNYFTTTTKVSLHLEFTIIYLQC